MADGYATPSIQSDPRQPAEENAPDIAKLKRMFEESTSLTATARTQSEKDRDYFDGPGQWTAAERAALARRKQPDNYFNRVRPAIEGTLGVIDQGQTDPRAFPRTPNDEDAADTATKTLKYIEDQSRFDRTKIDCAENYYVEGTCAVIVEVDERQDIQPNIIRWEEFFYDPRSRRKDFKDARYMGIAKWRYADEVEAEYPDKQTEIGQTLEMGDASFQDRPENGATDRVSWVDKSKRRVMVVELYHKEGRDWFRCVFYSGGVLDYGKSAYQDSHGQTKCPIEAASCYVDRENNRYGKVRDMRGPQDEINKRRSKALHILSTSQIQAVDPSAVEVNPDIARSEAAKPDGVIPFGWQKVPMNDVVTGQLALLAEAKGEIDRMGPNPAILGRQGENQSGRANLVRQQAGLTELAPTLGVFDDFLLRIYRSCWECVRQFWTAPKWIRTTDDVGTPQFVGLNVPPGTVDPKTGEPMTPNSVAQMDVDIIIETTPDTANVQQEQFAELAKLLAANPAWQQQVGFETLIELSTIQGKRQILEKLKAQKEAMAPKQQEVEQMGQMAAIAELEKTKSETALNQAKTETEMLKPQIEAVKAFQTGHQIAAAGQDTGGPSGQSDSFPPQSEAGPPPFG